MVGCILLASGWCEIKWGDSFLDLEKKSIFVYTNVSPSQNSFWKLQQNQEIRTRGSLSSFSAKEPEIAGKGHRKATFFAFIESL
jgi:hypothetical protein